MGPDSQDHRSGYCWRGVIDRDVIKWWLKQSREAQSAILTD
ncbi:hypothetical protein ACLB1R_09075 [Escherichia coli]